jgi:hypothetical protein
LFGFIDLQDEGSFFDGFSFGHLDGGHFAFDLRFQVDGLLGVQCAGGTKGFQERTGFDGHQFNGDGGVFGGSAALLTGGESDKDQKKTEMLHFMNV